MDKEDKILFECVDMVLSEFQFIDKATFYVVLQSKYQVDLNSITKDFALFHQALKETYGIKHHKIDRAIVKTLHTRTQQGYYKITDEIPIIALINQVFINESEENIELIKKIMSKKSSNLGRSISSN